MNVYEMIEWSRFGETPCKGAVEWLRGYEDPREALEAAPYGYLSWIVQEIDVKAYKRIREPALEAYERIRKTALEAYDRIEKTAREAYERKVMPDLRAFVRTSPWWKDTFGAAQ